MLSCPQTIFSQTITLCHLVIIAHLVQINISTLPLLKALSAVNICVNPNCNHNFQVHFPRPIIYKGYIDDSWYKRTLRNDKKGKRNVQGVPQLQAAALPRHQEEEETDKTKQAQIEQTYKKR